MVTETLAGLASGLAVVEVDGERADALDPQFEHYATVESIAREAGISPDAPKYSGMHHHCQYSRNG